MRLLDIESRTPAAFAAAFEGCDAVVFAAGGGADGNIERKRTVDLEGSLKSVEGAAAAGISRFVQVSAIGVDNPLPDDTGDGLARRTSRRSATPTPRCATAAWTGRSCGPARLTDDPGTGLVEIAPEVERARSPAPTSPR